MKGSAFLEVLEKGIGETDIWYMLVNKQRVYLRIYSTKLIWLLTQNGVRLLDTMDLVDNKFYKEEVR